MWNNYIIVMFRKYKTWSGLAIVNLIGLIAVYGLAVMLIRGFIVNPSTLLLILILIVLFVAAIAYVNYTTLQLRKRTKEFYIRKLLGARNWQIAMQLAQESLVFTSFMVVSGMVFAELLTPLSSRLLGVQINVEPISFLVQLIIVIALVTPLGLVILVFPVNAFLKFLSRNISRLSHRRV